MSKLARYGIIPVACLFVLLPMRAEAGRIYGVFRVVKGQVKVKDDKGKIKRARIGGKVFPNDTVITSKDSRAKIIMVDKNILNVSPNSQMVIEKYQYNPAAKKKNVLINVLYGKVRSKVEQKYDGKNNRFQVKTPSAVAGVRGTDFFTSFNSHTRKTRVVTFGGEVHYGQLGANGTIRNGVSVRAGQMAQSIGSASPTPPVSIPKAQLAKFDIGSDADKAPAIRHKDDKREPAGKENHEGNGDKDKKGPDNGKNPDQHQDVKQAKGPDGGGGPGAPGMAGVNGPDQQSPDQRSPASVGVDGSMPPPAMGDPNSMLRPEDMPAAPDNFVTAGDSNFLPPPPPPVECFTCTNSVTPPPLQTCPPEVCKDPYNNLNAHVILNVIKGN